MTGAHGGRDAFGAGCRPRGNCDTPLFMRQPNAV